MKKITLIYIGATFILAIVIFVWGYNYLKGKDLFSKQMILYSRYHKIDGLVTANPVLINGKQVGSVNRIYFAPDHSGDLIVTFLIKDRFPIPKNTIARIVNATLLGAKSVDLKLGNSNQYVQSGDTLKGSVEVTLKDEVSSALAPMKARAERILSSADTLIKAMSELLSKETKGNLKESFHDVAGTLHNLNVSSAELKMMIGESRVHVTRTLANLDSLTGTLSSSRGDLKATITNLRSVSDSLSTADIAGTIREAKASLERVNRLLAKMNQGEGTIGQLMVNDSLYMELNKSVRDLDLLLKDMKENPHRYLKFSVF
ncbi:MlaD family protein [Candidatus Sulfidibacterium hydrothermale]|uniref:MlaD family protein n=1 Tax=Candidatus Sulfidibacterium hydrothermale TaxID=2875962 RepID=UPI001F0A5367|nr:MlaD family protein [Candidatus Sulfidibacterium hydrothermale]UBM62369.1 MlaD family protein [Candidatus Sulfidibacterium hydrothermale]